MRFAPSFPNFGSRAPLQTFECKQCAIAVTAEEVLEILDTTAPLAPA